jgi:hypothetical protein
MGHLLLTVCCRIAELRQAHPWVCWFERMNPTLVLTYRPQPWERQFFMALLCPRLSGAPEHIVILFIINKLPSLHDLTVSETINDKIVHLDSLAVSLYAPVLEFMRVFIYFESAPSLL